MGVKFAREYEDIVGDLSCVLAATPQIYEFFEMEEADWLEMSEEERKECIQTMADDLFYALGTESTIPLGSSTIAYDHKKHIIRVSAGSSLEHIIKLV